MRQSAPPTDRALGQFFTPPEVVDLAFAVLAWLQPDLPRGRLVDLSCGEGAFLLGALRAGFAAERLTGLDADARLLPGWREHFAAALPHLAVADGLLGPLHAQFDVVAGNPPFAGGPAPEHEAYLTAQYRWWQLTHARRPLGLPRELWFLERSLGLLRPGGLLGLVLPEGFLANKRWRPQREVVLATTTLEAVIGLPRSVFRGGGTTVKTCLLFVRKVPPAAAHRVRLAELAEGELGEAGCLIAAWEREETIAGERPWRWPPDVK